MSWKKKKLKETYNNLGRRIQRARQSYKKTTSSQRDSFLSEPFFRYDLKCGAFPLLAVQGIWAYKIYCGEKKIENRSCSLGNAENCWIALTVSCSLGNTLKKYLRLAIPPELMPTKSQQDRERKKFRLIYDSLSDEWKQGGEFAGKIVAFAKFECVTSSTALQIDPIHTFPDFYSNGKTKFWRVMEMLKLEPSEMFKFSVGGAVG